MKYMETPAWEFPPETTSGNSPSLRPRQQTHYTKENDAKDFLLEKKKKQAGGREYTAVHCRCEFGRIFVPISNRSRNRLMRLLTV